ncbi:uncharacterized protein A4U43_C08F2490 [Asparagus officinalis]|nr:uncharacterized protein A4U43_C08F2490 [Asparagus officinalis]
MAAAAAVVAAVVLLAAAVGPASAGDPYAYFDWNIAYKTVAPLGVEQKVIAVNDEFPGPVMNLTTNWNVVVNVLNSLDEPLLLSWVGVQQRRNSWQDGVLGTNCPIPPGWNWTYQFQVKDQIGSFYYFPSTNFQRAAGGFGGLTINNRPVISVPFDTPHGDITLFIGDWYNRNHTDLRKKLDDGKGLGVPDGVLMNGKGPYRYNNSLVPAGIDYETLNVEPGKTYRLRVHNVGIKTCLNFRIQNHNLLLVETEGTYTVAQNYTNLDICVGQSYSFLVTMDQNASSDYYIVGSARFVNGSHWDRVTGVGILHYSNSKGKASGPLPDPPQDFFDKTFSMNQARSIRWVYPGAWTAVLVSLDNVGFWNVRTENLDTWYLGQEVYVKVFNPEGNEKNELPVPDNALYCGLLSDKQKAQKPHSKNDSAASPVLHASVKFIFSMLLLVAVATFP